MSSEPNLSNKFNCEPIFFTGTNHKTQQRFSERCEGYIYDRCREDYPIECIAEAVSLTDILFPAEGPLKEKLWKMPGTFDKRVGTFLNCPQVLNAKFFFAPIDGDKKRKGIRGKLDVPNLTFAAFSWLAENLKGEIIVLNALDSIMSKTLQGINLTKIAEQFNSKEFRQGWDEMMSSGSIPESESVAIVNYQSSNGNVRNGYDTFQKVLLNAGAKNIETLHVRLAPGKYGVDGVVDQRCYNELDKSIAFLALNLVNYSILVKAMGYSIVSSVDIILDEFSGYAMFMPFIIYGLGIQSICNVLCFRQGSYTRMPCTPEHIQFGKLLFKEEDQYQPEPPIQPAIIPIEQSTESVEDLGYVVVGEIAKPEDEIEST